MSNKKSGKKQPPRATGTRGTRGAARSARGPRVEPRPEKRAEPPADPRPDTRPGRSDPPGLKTITREGVSGDWLYGRHSVAAALNNPARTFHQLLATKQGAAWLLDRGLRKAMIDHRVMSVTGPELDGFLPPGCVHQGVAAAVMPLPALSLEELDQLAPGDGPIMVLDQITDPQNIGALFRVGAAFHARAIITQDRRTPALAGALAKAAAGAVEIIPCIQVVNIARALTALKEMHYSCVGLSNTGKVALGDIGAHPRLALVIGAEGPGLRPLVAKSCDMLVHIPISDKVDSLNVATAAAIALYGVQR